MACRSASSSTGLREATGDCWPSRAQWKESSDSCPRPSRATEGRKRTRPYLPRGNGRHVARRELARVAAREGHRDAVVIHLRHGAAAVFGHPHGVAFLQHDVGLHLQRPGVRVPLALHAVVARAALVARFDFLVEVLEDHLPTALRAARVGGEQLDLAALSREVELHPAIAVVVEQGTARLLAVAPRAPGLLVVRLQASRQLIVYDVADVLPVDAHAESVGRDHGARRAAHEGILALGALAAAEAAVVELRLLALLGKPAVHLLGRPHGGAVHDPGAAGADDLEQRLFLLGLIGGL